MVRIIGLELICKLFNYTYKQLASELGLLPQQVNDWISGRRKIPEKYLPRLETTFQIPSSYIIKVLNEYDIIRIQEMKLNNDKRRLFSMERKQKRICVINYKGGVGKTTLAFNLAAGLSRHGKRVLLVDVDHQASLSRVCLKNKDFTVDTSIAAIFKAYVNNEKCMPDTRIIQRAPLSALGYQNLDILPSIEELDEFEFNLAETRNANDFQDWTKKTLICRWIDENNLKTEYDYIIFDCPPATMYITQNALAASDSYIVPLIPSELSLRGFNHLLHMINDKIYKRLITWEKMLEVSFNNDTDIDKTRNKLYDSFNGSIELKAVVLSMVQRTGNTSNDYGCTDVHRQGIDLLKNWEKNQPMLKDKILYDNIIYKRTEVESSMGIGIPVYDTNDEFKSLIDKLYNIL